MHSLTDLHWSAAKRILRYLAETPTHGILLRRNTPLTLHSFSDADWAGIQMISSPPMPTSFI